MRSFTVLANPISGNGTARQRAAALAAELRDAGAPVTVTLTESAEHATRSARAAVDQGRVVVSAGGDGLARDIADAVAPAGAVMGILAAGRGNDLARRLGVPADPAALAALLLTGQARPIDVLECQGVIIPGNLYAGIDSVANAMINANRWAPAALLYRLAPVIAMLRWRAAEYRLVIDGKAHLARGHTVVVGNSGGYGHGLDIVPSAIADDGAFDVMIAADLPRWKIATLIKEAETGAHVRRPEVTVQRAREIVIEASRPLPVCADGDYLADLPVTVRLLPAALNLIRP